MPVRVKKMRQTETWSLGTDSVRTEPAPARSIQEIIIALDERLLLLFVELARNDTRLVILKPQTMQERDQSRAAFIDEPEFLLDPGADLTCRTRQRSAYPRL